MRATTNQHSTCRRQDRWGRAQHATGPVVPSCALAFTADHGNQAAALQDVPARRAAKQQGSPSSPEPTAASAASVAGRLQGHCRPAVHQSGLWMPLQACTAAASGGRRRDQGDARPRIAKPPKHFTAAPCRPSQSMHTPKSPARLLQQRAGLLSHAIATCRWSSLPSSPQQALTAAHVSRAGAGPGRRAAGGRGLECEHSRSHRHGPHHHVGWADGTDR